MPRKNPDDKLTPGQALDRALDGTAKPPRVRKRRNTATKPPEERPDYPSATLTAKQERNAISNAKKAAAKTAAKTADGTFKERKGLQRGFTSVETFMASDDGKLVEILTSTTSARAFNGEDWYWDKQRLAVADSLADGHSLKETAAAHGLSRTTVYEWLHHPSRMIQKYIDKVTLDTSIANKRIRLTRLVRMADKLFRVAESKFERLLDSGPGAADKIDAESLKAIMSEYREFSMLIAKERMELVDIVKNENTNTNIELQGADAVEQYLSTFGDEERQQMMTKFNGAADQIIARYKG